MKHKYIIGTKADTGKLRYDLLPDNSIQEVVSVLTYGAKKYAPNNWKLIADWRNRYYSAAQRHMAAWRLGEDLDRESNAHHLAHAITNLLFILAMELTESKKK